MELAEVRKIIRESNYTDYLNKMEYEFNLPHLDISLKFVGIVNIFKFFKEQDTGWKLKSLDISGSQFNNSINFFSTAYTNIQSFISNFVSNSSYNENSIQDNFNNYYRSYFRPNEQVFLYDSSEVDFLLKVLVSDEQKFQGSYKFFTNQGMDYNSKKGVEGYMLGYEFANRENSVLFNRRESEKRFVNEIRNKLQNIEEDYQNEVISHIKKIEEDYINNTNLQDASNTKSRKILADWLLFSRNNFSNFLGNTNTDFNALFENSKSEFDNLQNQYGELLKLQEPVKYWKDRAGELNKKANNMMWILSGITAVAVVLTYILLWWTPEGMLESIFNGDKGAAIRWTIVFAIFISFIAFLFRAIMKFMFSNYHLARDAEEREKLTYLYISLLSKGDFSEEEKKIVFQALFSRSDTGLLKEDSSPTMPGISSIIEKNIK